MRKPAVDGKKYDSNGWYWACMYRKRIVALYPRHYEARERAFRANLDWEKNGWPREWSTKRFRFYFKGLEIDAYEHEWERTEKQKLKASD